MSAAATDLAARRFLVRQGDWEQQLDIRGVVGAALAGCAIFYYAETAGGSKCYSMELPLLGGMSLNALNALRVARIAAWRNAFVFGCTGMLVSLLNNDQFVAIVAMQTFAWAAVGYALTMRPRLALPAIAVAVALALLAAATRVSFSLRSGSACWVAAALALAAAATARALWLAPTSGAPLILILSASALTVGYLMLTGAEITSMSLLSGTGESLPLGEFVARLRESVQDPKVRALLNAGLADGRIGDDRIAVSSAYIAAGDILPTQTQIDLDKSVGYYLNSAAGSDAQKDMLALIRINLSGTPVQSTAPPITVARANGKIYVIDGHHRWSQQLIFGGANMRLNCNVIEAEDKGLNDPVKILKITQVAIAAATGNVPAAYANTKSDVFAMDQNAIRDYYEQKGTVGANGYNKNHADNYAEIGKIVPGGNGIDWLVRETVKASNKKQALGDLPREAMPQLDVGTSADDKLRQLAAGRINWAPPL